MGWQPSREQENLACAAHDGRVAGAVCQDARANKAANYNPPFVCQIENVPLTAGPGSSTRGAVVGLTGLCVWPVVRFVDDPGTEQRHLDLRAPYRAQFHQDHPSEVAYLHSIELGLEYHQVGQLTRHQLYQPKADKWLDMLQALEELLTLEKMRQFHIYNNRPAGERPSRMNRAGNITTDDLDDWLETPVVAPLLVCLQSLCPSTRHSQCLHDCVA